MPRPVGAASYKAKRYLEGEYVDGLWVQGDTKWIRIVASIQPFTGEELLSLPEGMRSRRPVQIWSQQRLRTGKTNVEPDEVLYEGEWYEIQEIDSHNSRAPISHGLYVGLRKEIE